MNDTANIHLGISAAIVFLDSVQKHIDLDKTETSRLEVRNIS